MTTRRIDKADQRAQSAFAVFRDALDGVKAASADLAAEEATHRATARVHEAHADVAKAKRESHERVVTKFEDLLS